MTVNKSPVNPTELSRIIRNVARTTPPQGCTLEELLEKIGREGLLLAAIVLTIPFLLPVSIPGTSTPFGLLIVLIGVSLLRRTAFILPKKFRRIRIQQKHMNAISERAARFLKKVEKWSKPRLPALTSKPSLYNMHVAAMMCSAILMMSPLPLPLSNTLPAYGILFLALGSLRHDGYLIIGGYLMVLLTIGYFVLTSVLGFAGLKLLFT